MEVMGTSACGGVAKGKIFVYERKESTASGVTVFDASLEVERFEEAKEIARGQLNDLYNQVVSEIGEEGASIFKSQQLMFDDPEFMDQITGLITSENVKSEYAVKVTGNHFYQLFSVLEDEYMKERAADIMDVVTRLINILESRPNYGVKLSEPSIILADDLSPSETVQLDKTNVLAFVTRYGSTNSHTTVLARNLNIPAIVCAEFPEDCDGKEGIVDGDSGILIIEPTEFETEEYEKKVIVEEEAIDELQALKGLPDVTKSGKEIKLYANIGGVEEVLTAVENDARGIGLFRSEFLYLQSDGFPNEEELFFAYQTVAESMGDKPIIIRTMDIGADKQADYFNLEAETNPALGYRGIRVSLDMLDVFKTELKAILRASAFGNIMIMLPLITSVTEVKRVKLIIDSLKKELDEEGAKYSDVPLGVMIETPAAVMIARELGEEVDFFSVGTNDLTQYTLVADRQNPKLESIYDDKHPAIIKMLQLVSNAAHATGCWVGICGELAADPEMTSTLIGMGFDELSVSPGMVLKIREKIRECD